MASDIPPFQENWRIAHTREDIDTHWEKKVILVAEVTSRVSRAESKLLSPLRVQPALLAQLSVISARLVEKFKKLLPGGYSIPREERKVDTHTFYHRCYQQKKNKQLPRMLQSNNNACHDTINYWKIIKYRGMIETGSKEKHWIISDWGNTQTNKKL